jgi:serine/threonine protein kinase
VAELEPPYEERHRTDPNLLDRDVEAPISSIADFEILRCLATHEGITSYLAARRGEFGFSKRVMLKVADEPFQRGAEVSMRLTDEARLGMRLSHPNLLAILDLGRDEGRMFLVREWVDGLGVRRLLQRIWAQKEEMPPAAALRIGVEVLRALHHLHTLGSVPWAADGIVHCAVTPSNVLLSTAGEVRIGNLFMARPHGRAASPSDRRPRASMIPAYQAPEVTAGRPPEPRSDQFALGAVLFECLAGERAFEGSPDSDWNRYRDDARVQKLLLRDAVPEPIRDVLLVALAPDPRDRFPDAATFKDELRRILHDHYQTDGDQELRDLTELYYAPLGSAR